MRKYKNFSQKTFSIILIVAIIAEIFFYSPKSAQAATYNFNQTDWSGGAATTTAIHPTNQTGWSYYNSASTTLNIGSQISLATTTGSITQTLDTDFSQGTQYQTLISGTGTAASIILDPETENNIQILNPKSEIGIGGIWEVRFTTKGNPQYPYLAINLKSQDEFEKDISFEGLYCDDQLISPEKYLRGQNWLYIWNWKCEGEGKFKAKVLKEGIQIIEFNFGGSSQVAENYNQSSQGLSPQSSKFFSKTKLVQETYAGDNSLENEIQNSENSGIFDFFPKIDLRITNLLHKIEESFTGFISNLKTKVLSLFEKENFAAQNNLSANQPTQKEVENVVLSSLFNGENIKILNPYSNPVVGGNWEVFFETKAGPANLTITPDKRSEFGKELEFVGIYCGDEKVEANYDGKKVFVENWNCEKKGKFVIKVIDAGAHLLQFKYKKDQVYAQNFACDSGSLDTTCYITTSQDVTGATISGTGNLVIQSGGSLYTSGGSTSTICNISMGGNITIAATTTVGLSGNFNITSTNFTINSGASINADVKGYAGGSGSNSGSGPGGGGGVYNCLAYGGGGGGYGGKGGSGRGGGGGGSVYGSLTQPTDLGSGGGGVSNACGCQGCGPGGAGGGAIKLNVSGTLTINGTISANGANGTTYVSIYAYGGGGGSGGSIWIQAGTIAGNGTTTANGGAGGGGFGGGGAGGRIAMYYNSSSFSGSLQAYGGSGNQYGGAGTIYQKNQTTNYSVLSAVNTAMGNDTVVTDDVTVTQLTLGNSFQINSGKTLTADYVSIASSSVSFTNSGTFNSSNLSSLSLSNLTNSGTINTPNLSSLTVSGTLTLNSGSTFNHSLTSLSAGTFNNSNNFSAPNLNTLTISSSFTNNSGASFTAFTANSSTSASIANLTNAGTINTPNLTSLTLSGNCTNTGTLTFNSAMDLTLNGTLNLAGTYSSFNSLTINNGGTLTHPNNTTTKTYYLDLTLNSLTINSGGKIDVSGKGYQGGTGTGSGSGPGGGGGTYGGGAGHGGSGGGWGGSAYDSLTQPNDLGSGGGGGRYSGGNYTCDATGGVGGGLVKLNINGNFTNNGSILANGTGGGSCVVYSCSYYNCYDHYAYGGGGAGGSIYISANNISGSGSITANGGNGGGSGAGGGAGGRIAIYRKINNFTGTVTANGGSGDPYYYAGGSGTIYLGTAYYSSGYFISSVIDTVANSGFGTLVFSASTTASTNIKFQLRSGKTIDELNSRNFVGPDGATSTYYTTSGTQIWSGHNGDKYIQYKAYLETSDRLQTPYLNDVTINYFYYYPSGAFISSPYDTSDPANAVAKIQWTATTPSSTMIKFQVRTSPDGINWSDFCGPDDPDNSTTTCSNSTYFTDPSGSEPMDEMFKDGQNDRWIQYKAILETQDQIQTPVLNNVSVTYVVNAPPEFNQSFGTNGVLVSQIASSTDPNWGKVEIQFSVRDPDTNSGTVTPGYITPSFEYNIGSGWNSIDAAHLSSGALDNKAVSEDTYTTYSVYWDAKSQIPNIYTPTAQIRVTISDNEAANSVSEVTSDVFTLDTKDPVASATLNNASSTLTFNFSDDSNIEYIISNNVDFSADGVNVISGAWQNVGANATSTTLSWTATGTYPTIYLKTRDIYGNTTPITVVAPYQPRNFYYKDISNPPIGDYREFLSWGVYDATTSAAWANYQVYRSTDGTNYSLLSTLSSNANINYYVDATVASTTTYYYKVLTTDSDGDTSSFTDPISDLPNGQGGSDTTAPIISNVAVAEISASWARITWTTDEISNSVVDYGTTNAYGSTETVDTMVTSHTVTLNNLTPNTLYYFRVKSSDINSNQAIDDNSGSGYSFTTLPGIIISDVTVESISDNSATIFWNTDKPANSYVVYSSDFSDLRNNSNVSEVGDASIVSDGPPYQHRVKISGLSPKTTYYYYVKSIDSDNNTTIDNNKGGFYIFKTTYDAKPPVISNIQTPVITRSATIVTWQTDEGATSQVEYGNASGSYTNITTLDHSFSIYHAVVLNNLSQNTTYYYRVKSMDAADNLAVSEEKQFTTKDVDQVIISTPAVVTPSSAPPPPPKDTTPPTISNIEVSNIGAFNATISFEVNEPAIAFVYYGRDTNYGNVAGSPEFSTKHEIKLSNLKMGTDYHFKIKAQDKEDNSSYSTDKTFTTKYAAEALNELVTLENASQFQEQLEGIIESVMPSLVPPVISNVEISDITENSAVVTWHTNVPAYGVLAYAADKDYNNSKENPYTAELNSGTTKSRTHKVELTNLSPATIYHIQVKAFVIPGAVGKYKDITFTTKASKIKPQISKLTNTEIEVRWVTDRETSSFVEYKDMRTGKVARSGDEAKTKSHLVLLQNLTPDTNYAIRAFGYDDNNTIVEGDSITVRTKKDITPPTISNIRIDNALLPGRNDKLQTVVSWRTNEPANSLVYFEEGVGVGEDLKNKTGQDKEFTTDHIVIITSFKPSTVYRIKIVSADESDNISASPVRTILTPRAAESVFDIISRNLQETFGFLKNIKR